VVDLTVILTYLYLAWRINVWSSKRDLF
jgi:hypothetical protein